MDPTSPQLISENYHHLNLIPVLSNGPHDLDVEL